MQKSTVSQEQIMQELQERVATLEAQMKSFAQNLPPAQESFRYLDLQNACDMLGVSRSTFYLELQSGRIPYTMVGRQRKFLEKDLKEYLRRNYVPAKKSII
jgi:excisionase family DNA binding protein